MSILGSVALGLTYASVGEWLAHKHLLHGLGRDPRRGSTHWLVHHRAARLHDFRDDNYAEPLSRSRSHRAEVVGLATLGLLHLPLLAVAPAFTTTVLLWGANYYRIHRRAHLDPAWARRNLPWHVDHHLGVDQNVNWGVTHPFVDVLVGTRVVGGARRASGT